jgi:hypothetical protein
MKKTGRRKKWNNDIEGRRREKRSSQEKSRKPANRQQTRKTQMELVNWYENFTEAFFAI